MKVLVAVDLQNDFITGCLGTKEAVSVLLKAAEKIKNFDGEVLFTRDTHKENYLETQEGKNLPVKHCVESSEGWRLSPDIAALCKNEPINKPTFGSVKLGEELFEMNKKEQIESITLIGLCTDICVISNAIIAKAFLPEVPIIVDAACCAGVTPESHKTALQAMRACQIKIENI